jgi:hypothetical protein
MAPERHMYNSKPAYIAEVEWPSEALNPDGRPTKQKQASYRLGCGRWQHAEPEEPHTRLKQIAARTPQIDQTMIFRSDHPK